MLNLGRYRYTLKINHLDIIRLKDHKIKLILRSCMKNKATEPSKKYINLSVKNHYGYPPNKFMHLILGGKLNIPQSKI